MATMAENVIAAGSENRPPMLEKGMYDSWKTRILLYIREKENAEMLIDSTKMTAKEVWDRVKELMKGTEMTKQERESMLYDEFDKFTSDPGESIHSYYLRYAKLITDIKMIPMSMSNMQINTKFVNHLQPEWSRDAKEVREMRQRFPDPLALLANTYNPPLSYNSQKIHQSQQRYDEDILPQITNYKLRLIQELKLQFKMAKLRFRMFKVDSLKVMRAVLERIKLQEQGSSILLDMQGKINQWVKNSEWFKDKMLLAQAQEAGVVLNDEQQDFLADNCDDEATTNAIFMANLSPIGSINDDMVEQRYDSDILSESCDELTSNNNVISYADYMVTISNNEDNYVPPPVQKNDRILSVKEMKDIFEEMEDEVEQLTMAKKYFEIEKKQLLINNDRLLEENIASDIMCTYLRSLNEVDNCGKCKSLNIVLLDLQESNKSLCELRKWFAKLKEYSITLDIAFQNHKEQMIFNDTDMKNKKNLVKTINNQSVEINDLKVQLQDKIQKIKDENVSLAFQLKGKFSESQMNHNGTSVNTKLSKPSTSGTKLYSVTPFPKSKGIPKVVKKNDLSKSVTSHLTTNKIIEKCTKVLASGHASKFAERIQELLLYVSASCPFTQSGNEKWAPTTSHRKNNMPYVDTSRMKQPIETITKEQAVMQNTQKTDNTMLPSTGRVSSTNASGSKSSSNTKNDRISQPSSRSMKNKVEARGVNDPSRVDFWPKQARLVY
ncbi:hypothetical protein Tco_1202020 [Tanacetum coccineum]